MSSPFKGYGLSLGEDWPYHTGAGLGGSSPEDFTHHSMLVLRVDTNIGSLDHPAHKECYKFEGLDFYKLLPKPISGLWKNNSSHEHKENVPSVLEFKMNFEQRNLVPKCLPMTLSSSEIFLESLRVILALQKYEWAKAKDIPKNTCVMSYKSSYESNLKEIFGSLKLGEDDPQYLYKTSGGVEIKAIEMSYRYSFCPDFNDKDHMFWFSRVSPKYAFQEKLYTGSWENGAGKLLRNSKTRRADFRYKLDTRPWSPVTTLCVLHDCLMFSREYFKELPDKDKIVISTKKTDDFIRTSFGVSEIKEVEITEAQKLFVRDWEYRIKQEVIDYFKINDLDDVEANYED